MNKKLRNITLIAAIPSLLAASPLSDKIIEVKNYLTARNFSVQENVKRTFSSPDTSYTFPLLLDENDSNINAGMTLYMLATIDTIQNAGKKTAVEDSSHGIHIVVGINTAPDSVYRAIKAMPVNIENQSVLYIRNMLRNSPNPFNSITNIEYTLESDADADLDILNSKGQTIAHILKRQETQGNHAATWNGKDNYGKNVSAGNYLACLKTADKKGTSQTHYRRLTCTR